MRAESLYAGVHDDYSTLDEPRALRYLDYFNFAPDLVSGREQPAPSAGMPGAGPGWEGATSHASAPGPPSANFHEAA